MAEPHCSGAPTGPVPRGQPGDVKLPPAAGGQQGGEEVTAVIPAVPREWVFT